ncbi:MAG: reverse transcriptase domain-containing protein, partial [Ferruginibacter sp.]
MDPLLANLNLHHAFDRWMAEVNHQNPFERYADDIVIHCNSKEEAEQLLEKLKVRMHEFELTLHPEKTKIVCCKNYQRLKKHNNESFTSLSYSFQPRTIKSKLGGRFLIFGAGIFNAAKTHIKTCIKEILRTQRSTLTLEWFAGKPNPKIRGWINYYTRFSKKEAHSVFYYLNELIRKWIRNKYKIQGTKLMHKKYELLQAETPLLFYHWK